MSYGSYLGNRLARFFSRMPADQLNQVDAMLTEAEAAAKADPSQLHGIRVNESVFGPVDKALSDVDTAAGHPQDLWNASNGHGFEMNNINTGATERSSGGGAPAMVHRYSDPAEQSSLVAAYDSLSARMGDVEKAIAALTSFLAKTNGGTFPSDSRGNNGNYRQGEDEDESRKNGNDNSADSDDDSDVEKALRGEATLVHSVPSFLNALANKSRHPGVATPPSFMKANTGRTRSFDDDLSDLHDDTLNFSDGELIKAGTLRAALAHHRAGVLSAEQFERVKNTVPPKVREALLGEAA